jgi:hypothetical protein
LHPLIPPLSRIFFFHAQPSCKINPNPQPSHLHASLKNQKGQPHETLPPHRLHPPPRPPTLALCAPAPANLALKSQIAYSTVIQGGQDPVYGFVYNVAPTGSAAGNYSIFANYLYGTSPVSTGTKAADAGAAFQTTTFNFDSSKVNPGTNIPIAVTATDLSDNVSLTQGGTVNVLAHAAPGLVLQGSVVVLTSKNKYNFATTATDNKNLPDLSNASLPPQDAGTEGPAGGFAPGMIGDPPGEPTADLDLDSISASGNPVVALGDLSPFDDLPSTDSASENVVPFWVELYTDTPGTYTDTFTLHYSDEQDLPGADAPGSQSTSFSVTATLDAADNIQWEVDTAVPEPAPALLLLLGALPTLFHRTRPLCG